MLSPSVLFLSILTLLLLPCLAVQEQHHHVHPCIPTTIDDILVAARHSDYVYDNSVKVESSVIGAEDYKVSLTC